MNTETIAPTAVLPPVPTVTSGQIAVAPVIVDGPPHLKHDEPASPPPAPAAAPVTPPRAKRSHKKRTA